MTRRIFLAEDNLGDQVLIQEVLEDLGVDVVYDLVADGELAWAYLRGIADQAEVNLPHLLILDINLPKIDGLQLLDFCKKQHRLKNIPTLIISSSTANRDKEKARQLGAAYFFTKPDNIQEYQPLLNMVKNIFLPNSPTDHAF